MNSPLHTNTLETTSVTQVTENKRTIDLSSNSGVSLFYWKQTNIFFQYTNVISFVNNCCILMGSRLFLYSLSLQALLSILYQAPCPRIESQASRYCCYFSSVYNNAHLLVRFPPIFCPLFHKGHWPTDTGGLKYNCQPPFKRRKNCCELVAFYSKIFL